MAIGDVCRALEIRYRPRDAQDARDGPRGKAEPLHRPAQQRIPGSGKAADGPERGALQSRIQDPLAIALPCLGSDDARLHDRRGFARPVSAQFAPRHRANVHRQIEPVAQGTQG